MESEHLGNQHPKPFTPIPHFCLTHLTQISSHFWTKTLQHPPFLLLKTSISRKVHWLLHFCWLPPWPKSEASKSASIFSNKFSSSMICRGVSRVPDFLMKMRENDRWKWMKWDLPRMSHHFQSQKACGISSW